MSYNSRQIAGVLVIRTDNSNTLWYSVPDILARLGDPKSTDEAMERLRHLFKGNPMYVEVNYETDSDAGWSYKKSTLIPIPDDKGNLKPTPFVNEYLLHWLVELTVFSTWEHHIRMLYDLCRQARGEFFGLVYDYNPSRSDV